MKEEIEKLMDFYPRIYFACHTRHVQDPDTSEKLTANQASILDHLDVDEPLTLLDLAIHMGVTPSTMSITIKRLEKSGYIMRERDKLDFRKVNLYLTKKGVKIKQAKSVLDPKRVKALLKRLNKSERDKALNGLGLLALAADNEMKNRSLSRSWNNR